MKKKSILLIVGLMSFALMGVLAMQWYFLHQSYKLKSQLFDQSVNESLNNVVKQLEKQDAFNFLLNKAVDTQQLKKPQPPHAPAYRWVKKENKNPESYAAYLRKQQRKADSLFLVRDSLLRNRYPLVLAYDGGAEVPEIKPEFQVEVLQFEDAAGQIHQQTFTRAVPRIQLRKLMAGRKSSNDSVKQYVVFDPMSGPRLVTLARPKLSELHRDSPDGEKKTHEIRYVKEFLDSVQLQRKDVIQDLAQEFKQTAMPLKKRIEPALLDSLLRKEFRNKGISGDFAYQVRSGKSDSVVFRKASIATPFTQLGAYKVQLFPKELLREAGWLIVTFPDKNQHILSNMSWIMVLSAGLLLVLLFSFGYTLQMILRQKKISEMKTDFINNMTHEFKTPVATIMIASEALKEQEVQQDKSRIDRLAGIIYDENVRLGNHIERVLQAARIEQETLKLEMKKVEVNTLLAAVVDSMALQFQKNGAAISLQLDAVKDSIRGDELHLSNVFFNLLDNALKYCSAEPKIEVITLNSGNQLIIRVKDNGIGMSRDQLSKIFEQFYRIPTGNLHDVKGFGLGLSYVNTIVKHLKGTIRVKSEKDRGSEFEISLPLS